MNEDERYQIASQAHYTLNLVGKARVTDDTEAFLKKLCDDISTLDGEVFRLQGEVAASLMSKRLGNIKIWSYRERFAEIRQNYPEDLENLLGATGTMIAGSFGRKEIDEHTATLLALQLIESLRGTPLAPEERPMDLNVAQTEGVLHISDTKAVEAAKNLAREINEVVLGSHNEAGSAVNEVELRTLVNLLKHCAGMLEELCISKGLIVDTVGFWEANRESIGNTISISGIITTLISMLS